MGSRSKGSRSGLTCLSRSGDMDRKRAYGYTAWLPGARGATLSARLCSPWGLTISFSSMKEPAIVDDPYCGTHVLVFGASGFIGRWVARGLCARGAKLSLVVRNKRIAEQI